MFDQEDLLSLLMFAPSHPKSHDKKSFCIQCILLNGTRKFDQLTQMTLYFKGCRTVFVGGLPENMTEEIITEIFEKCGEITTLRLSKKNFCHLRFVFEASVDAAIFLSGYRVRIGSNADSANTGRLHVDYAQVNSKTRLTEQLFLVQVSFSHTSGNWPHE